MRFVVDAQLPPALARLLESQGHSAEHVADIGLRHAGDTAIWDYALSKEAIILTKDEDFAQRQQSQQTSPVVVWLRVGNTSRRALLQWFEPLLPKVLTFIARGDRLVEVR